MKLNVSGETIESLLYRGNNPILELKISYPQILGPLSKESEFRFNNHYRSQARNLNRKTRTECYKNAWGESELAEKEEFDFTLHSFLRTFYTPRVDPQYTSVALDEYQFSGGPHGSTVRRGNTWNLTTGIQVPLSYFFRAKTPYRQILIHHICEQISKQQKNRETLFFENPPKNATRFFSEKNYYLTHNSIVIFYPLYTIAPYHTGILNYHVPFGELEKCWIPARRPTEIPPYQGRFSEGMEQGFL